MMKDNKVLKLNAKPHAKFGIISLLLVLVSFVLGLMAVLFASSSGPLLREEQIRIGVFEWISFMLNLIGITFGSIAQFSQDTEKIFAHIALILHTILLIFHLVVVWVGFM